MYEPLDPNTQYPRSHAFLIRFRGNATCNGEHCSGRIERITDFGAFRNFSSQNELLALLSDALRESTSKLP